jgi:hypothetical protein
MGADLAKCDGSNEPRSEALHEQRTSEADYGEVTRDWNYVATRFSVESAFIFKDFQREKFIVDESAFMRFTALTVSRALRRLAALLENPRLKNRHWGTLRCLTSTSIVHFIVQLSCALPRAAPCRLSPPMEAGT